MENGLLPASPAVLPLIFYRLLRPHPFPAHFSRPLNGISFSCVFSPTNARSPSIFSVSVDAVLISFGQHTKIDNTKWNMSSNVIAMTKANKIRAMSEANTR